MGKGKRIFEIRLRLFYSEVGGSGFSQTLVPICQTLERHIIQNPNLQSFWFSNLLLISIILECQKYVK